MIDPEGNFCKVWNIVLMLLLIYTDTYMPFKLAFISDADTNTTFIVDNVVYFMFMFDMCVNFNLPIRNKDDTYEYSRKIVAMTYLKSWFFIDLMASLPMTLIQKYIVPTGFNLRGQNLIRMARLPRLYRMLRMARLLKIVKMFKSSSFFGHI